jgi:hypothetical protein
MDRFTTPLDEGWFAGALLIVAIMGVVFCIRHITEDSGRPKNKGPQRRE